MTYNIELTPKECEAIREIITADMENLDLADSLYSAYDDILHGISYSWINFTPVDEIVAHEIAQCFLVYADRILSAEGYTVRASALLRFAMQMMNAYTYKTEADY